MTEEFELDTLAAAARRERFELLYAENQARVLGYVLRRTDRAEDAADVVAETFLIAWRRLDHAPSVDARLWLYGVARRVLANHRRGERRRTQLASQLRSDLARRDPAPVVGEKFAELAVAFRSLPEDDRELLALEGWEQLDVGEIALVLGCSRNAVRIRLHRARRRLRAAVAESTSPKTRGVLDVRPATAPPSRLDGTPTESGANAPRNEPHYRAELIIAPDVIVTRGEIA